MDHNHPPSSFRLGQSGTCEATLFAFFGKCLPGSPEAPVRRVAATELFEAAVYMHKRHRDFRIERVEVLGLIDMVSGSPLD